MFLLMVLYIQRSCSLNTFQFLREELQYDSGYEKRQRAFHHNDDMHISVKELWEAWLRSEVCSNIPHLSTNVLYLPAKGLHLLSKAFPLPTKLNILHLPAKYYLFNVCKKYQHTFHNNDGISYPSRTLWVLY